VVEHLQGPVRFPLFSAGWQRRLFKSNPFRIKTILIQMKLRFQHDCSGIDWETIPAILETVGMSFHDSDIHRRTFLASSAVVFVFDDQQLVGFGRAISDGFIQAAIYDVAVLPTHQGNGIGKQIIEKIVATLPGCNFILYASPGKELFYEKLKFRRMKTAMALFVKSDRMSSRGFTE
jgi:ribosomal protein S18 acetylase RimI-like enzyme